VNASTKPLDLAEVFVVKTVQAISLNMWSKLSMKKLNFYNPTDLDDLAWPEEQVQISTDTPALAFFADFREVPPLVIEVTTPALAAKEMMRRSHVRLKFVVDSDNHFLGVISSEDLDDQALVRKRSEGFKSSDIEVGDLMTPKKSLKAFDINQLQDATIGEVIDALTQEGQHYALVLDRQSNQILGILSAQDISRKLHRAINIKDRTRFYKVFAAADRR
jgi:CBS domain containing-hemolysin-like protein